MREMSANACGCLPCSNHHQHHQHSHLRHLKRPINLKTNNNNSLYSTLDDELNINNNNNNGMPFGLNGDALDESLDTTEMTRMDCIAMSLALMIIPFIPATNLFFYVGFVIAERILYIPSFGYCLLIAIAIESFLKRKSLRFMAFTALAVLLVSFSLRTVFRNMDWLTEESLYRSGISINPPKGNGHSAQH